MRENVAKLRKLLAEAVPEEKRDLPQSASISVEQNPRARAEREISRITSYYGWHAEVYRFLDQEAELGIVTLNQEQLDRLVLRLRKLEECLLEGFDHPDCAVAR